MEGRTDCHFKDLPYSHFCLSHAPVQHSAIEVASNNDPTGGVPNLIIERVDHLTVVSNRLFR